MSEAIVEDYKSTTLFNSSEPYRTRGEIENLVIAFEACTLPKSYWTHQAHLIVSLWYNLLHDEEAALDDMREGILRYNGATGTRQTPTGGYHETMTVFWMWAVRRYINCVSPGTSFVELANGMLKSRCSDKTYPFDYYSRERLFSWEARTGWMEPDLKIMSDA